jgi:hypothetical protein
MLKRYSVVASLFVLLLAVGKSDAQITIRALGAQEGQIFALPSAQFGFSNLSGVGMGNHVPSDTMGMLRMQQFIEELELADEQVKQLAEIQQEMQKQTREIFRGADFGGGDTAKVMREAQRAIREQTEKRLDRVLSSRQLKRLKQIQVQLQMRNRGAGALASDALAEALDLSDDQKKELAEKQKEAQKKLQEEIQRLREQYREEVVEDVLTRSQVRKLKDLIGDEYEVKKPNYRSAFAQPRPSDDKNE